MNMTRQQLRQLDGALVYMPKNQKVRLGTIDRCCDSVSIIAPISETINHDSS